MEKEAAIPPIQLYIETTALQRAAKTASDRVEKESAEALEGIWKTLIKSRRKTRRPLVPLEALRDRAKDRENEIQGFLAHQKDHIEQEAAMNPCRRSQRNAGRA